MNKKEITLSDAIQVVKERLKKDEDYYDTWHSIIGNTVYNELYKRKSMDGKVWVEKGIAYDTAQEILKQLMK